MENRLTQTQLTQIVAEVERLSNLRQSQLDSEEVKEILRELRLPPELLNEASLIQLQRREALAQQQRRNRWIAGGLAATAAGAIAITGCYIHRTHWS